MWITQEADHSKAFWAENDASGWDKVNRAAEMRGQWHGDAKKDDKKEGEVTKDDEADEMPLVEDTA